jgi:hypothetical protein
LGTEIGNGIIIVKIIRESVEIEPITSSSVRRNGSSVGSKDAVWVPRWIGTIKAMIV